MLTVRRDAVKCIPLVHKKPTTSSPGCNAMAVCKLVYYNYPFFLISVINIPGLLIAQLFSFYVDKIIKAVPWKSLWHGNTWVVSGGRRKRKLRQGTASCMRHNNGPSKIVYQSVGYYYIVNAYNMTIVTIEAACHTLKPAVAYSQLRIHIVN